MTKKQEKSFRQKAKQRETTYVKEQKWTNRIVRWIILGTLLVFLLGGLATWFYVNQALKPVNPDKKDTVEVTVPIGSSSSDMARILKEANMISNEKVFSYYYKFNKQQELKAGHYQISPSMDAEQIVEVIEKGGKPIFQDVDTKITIVEGMQLDEIAKVVGENTGISEEEFMDKINDEKFIQKMQKAFPDMLEGTIDNDDLKYPLEGYLFPYTYDYTAGMSAENLISKMVESSNQVYQSFAEDLANTNLSYHEVLTLASIIEKEAVTPEDRGLVSGVFYNRIAQEMPLESDITVLYALGEHKEFVTFDDLEVDSPYNLYKHTGLGPGPFNTPSRQSIEYAIYPTWNDYLYFVADLDTGDVYYSASYEEHQVLVEEYVNERQASIEAGEDQSEGEDSQETPDTDANRQQGQQLIEEGQEEGTNASE